MCVPCRARAPTRQGAARGGGQFASAEAESGQVTGETAMADNGAAAGQLGIPRGSPPLEARASMDVHVRVWAKAREFGKPWAKATFGRNWTRAKVYGKIVEDTGKNEWIVEFDPIEEGAEPDRQPCTSRQINIDKDHEATRIAAIRATDVVAAENKGVEQCMAQGCSGQLVSGNKHCRCCGNKVCTWDVSDAAHCTKVDERRTVLAVVLATLVATPILAVPVNSESAAPSGRQLQNTPNVEDTAAIPCAAPATRFCTTCDACCKDLDAYDCGACISSTCDASHRCIPSGNLGCNVCPECCKSFLHSQIDCDACVEDTCVPMQEEVFSASCSNHGTDAHAVTCCATGCWTYLGRDSWQWPAPCVLKCLSNPFLLLGGVMIPMFLRSTLDFYWSELHAGIIHASRHVVFGEYVDELHVEESSWDIGDIGQRVWVRADEQVPWLRSTVTDVLHRQGICSTHTLNQMTTPRDYRHNYPLKLPVQHKDWDKDEEWELLLEPDGRFEKRRRTQGQKPRESKPDTGSWIINGTGNGFKLTLEWKKWPKEILKGNRMSQLIDEREKFSSIDLSDKMVVWFEQAKHKTQFVLQNMQVVGVENTLHEETYTIDVQVVDVDFTDRTERDKRSWRMQISYDDIHTFQQELSAPEKDVWTVTTADFPQSFPPPVYEKGADALRYRVNSNRIDTMHHWLQGVANLYWAHDDRGKKELKKMERTKQNRLRKINHFLLYEKGGANEKVRQRFKITFRTRKRELQPRVFPLVKPKQGRLRCILKDKEGRPKEVEWDEEEAKRKITWKPENIVRKPPYFTMRRLCSYGSSWEAALDANDWTEAKYTTYVVPKLIFFHLLQPALYIVAFFNTYPRLDKVQQFFGIIVVIREGICILTVLLCILFNPAFLLVNLSESRSDVPTLSSNDIEHKAFRAFQRSVFESCRSMYILAPEKFVMFALLSKGSLLRGTRKSRIDDTYIKKTLSISVLFDLCAVVGLGYGLGVNGLSFLWDNPALVCGYVVTSLAAVWLMPIIVTSSSKQRTTKGRSGVAGASAVNQGVILILLTFSGAFFWGDDVRESSGHHEKSISNAFRFCIPPAVIATSCAYIANARAKAQRTKTMKEETTRRDEFKRKSQEIRHAGDQDVLTSKSGRHDEDSTDSSSNSTTSDDSEETELGNGPTITKRTQYRYKQIKEPNQDASSSSASESESSGLSDEVDRESSEESDDPDETDSKRRTRRYKR